MGMRALMKAASVTAFNAVGDVVVPIVLSRPTLTYVSATGAMSTTTTSYDAKAIFTSFAVNEIDNIVVLGEDEKIIVRQAGLAVTPLMTDHIFHDGKEHQIRSIKQDPAGATWTLHIRAAS